MIYHTNMIGRKVVPVEAFYAEEYDLESCGPLEVVAMGEAPGNWFGDVPIYLVLDTPRGLRRFDASGFKLAQEDSGD